MAYIVPSDISRLALAGAKEPELATLADLKAALPPDYTVFHGVHWARDHKGASIFGEIDFVVLNRSGDVLVIEQKNGALDETDAGLVKNYDDGSKNVGDQIRRSLENVREKFKFQHSGKRLHIDYMIYCPDFRLKHLNAAALDHSRIVHAGSADTLADRIEQVLGVGEDDDLNHFLKVEEFFTQTFDLVPDINAHIAAQQRSFTRLSGGLVQTLSNIEMEPLRLRVSGTAGCGKSLAAKQFHDRAIESGQRPLLVCFNRPLAERLKQVVAKGGMVTTWNGLCDTFLTERGHTYDYKEMGIDPDFWKKLQDLVIGEEIGPDWKFDCLIVDEGQDFEREWLDILRLFLNEPHDIIWFEDANQNLLRRGESADLSGFVTFRAKTNYRSPERIARYIQRKLPFEFECGNDLPGFDVGTHEYEDPKEQAKIVSHLVTELVRDGFEPADIAILTCRGVNRSILSTAEEIGGHKVRRFTGEYDTSGSQLFTEGELLFDSVYRFKGQEAHAVILMDVEPEEGSQCLSGKKLIRWNRL